MPAQELSHRREYALLWVKTGSDQRAQPTVSPTSVDIQVQWVDKESEALDPQGNVIRVDAQAGVARDIPVGSIMWRGSYRDLEASLPGTGSATTTDVPLSGLLQVVMFDGERDLKGRVTARTVGLVRWGDAMPAQQV